jgi:hypothetical protein
MPLLLPSVRPSDQFSKPFGKQAPQPPEQSDKNAENEKSGLELRHPYQCDESGKGQVNEEDAESDLCEKLQDLPPNRYPRLRRREFPAATLGTDIGAPWIRVQAGT